MEEASKPGRTATTWTEGWDQQNPPGLYEGFAKHEATALFFLRTGVMGLRNWLAKIGVPGIDPICTCRRSRQTLEHIRVFCPELEPQRRAYIQELNKARRNGVDIHPSLSNKNYAKRAVRWLLSTGRLEQFKFALETEDEDMRTWSPFTLDPEDRGNWNHLGPQELSQEMSLCYEPQASILQRH
jgi:hypothetical protein